MYFGVYAGMSVGGLFIIGLNIWYDALEEPKRYNN